MTTYSRPGVFIQEVELPQTIALADSGNAVGAFTGALSKGPSTVPVLLSSWSDFVKTFGGLNDAYPTTWAAYNFFANGGRQLYVKRVVASDAVAASVTLTDGATTDLLEITAKNPGAWGSDLAVQVNSAGTSTRFGLSVFGAPITAVTTSNLLSQWTDLSMDPADRNYVVSVINSDASSPVTIAVVGAATTFPTPAATLYSLTSGDDGTTLVRADYSGAYASFDPINNPLVMYTPDAAYASTDTISGQISGDLVIYCSGRTDAFAVLDTPSGMTVTGAQEQVDDIKAIFAASSAGEIAATYYPWISIPDATKIPGATRLQAPGAAMVGQYLATDASRGVFKTPAGLGNKIALAVATESQLTNANLDALNSSTSPINVIRQVPGAGIVVMGGRTLDNTPGNRYINVRRSMIYLKKEITDLSGFAIFENNDSRLWGSIRTTLNVFLRSYWQQGGLRGSSPEQAFFVRCDASNNSTADIQNGRVNIEIGVALEYPAEFVVIKLGQLTGNATA